MGSNRVHEHRAEHVDEQVLLVLMQLGIEPIDDLLARLLGADLALEESLQRN
ncbi:MAG TPA: hypothetical protein VKP69_33490 [Isosphaeraceae bacterium]|nr:hypothetical protein [Isosphaeraceae bacterium]